MPRLIKCPSCATQMDVGDAQPGTVVGCPGCQVKIRIPTGKTGKHPAISGATPAPAPAPQVAPAKASTGSSSRVRRRGVTTKTRTAAVGSRRGMGGGRGGDDGEEGDGRYAPPEKKKNTGLIVGICVGAVVLVGLIIIIVVSGKKPSGPIPRPRTDDDMTASKPPPTQPSPVADPTPIVPSGNPGPEKPPGAGSDLKPGASAPKGRAQWDKYIDGLKKYGIKNHDPVFYDMETDPECELAWGSVKRLGSNAYPYLLYYLGDEDPQRVKGAAAALWTLLNLPGKTPKPGQGLALQGELKSKCGVSDADIKKAEEELK